MSTVFDYALAVVLDHEGGYVNDPADPGGETYKGISRRAHPEAWANGRPTDDQIREIYLNGYWLAIDGPELPPVVAICLFDAAVNVGVRQAVRLMQRALRVTDDGIMGPVTRGSIQQADATELVGLFSAERISFYAGLNTWQRYGRGWTKRTVMVAMAAREFAA